MTPHPAPHIIRWFLRTFRYGGVCLYPLGIYILAERIHEVKLVKHEQCHWKQAQSMGALRFWVTYLWYNLRYGYWNNPLERDARAAELKD